MNALRYVLGFPWVQPLGWTLVHFLWQGALIGLIAAIVLPLARRASSQMRYLLACGFLALCVVAPATTFVFLARPPSLFGEAPRIIGNASAPDFKSSPLQPTAASAGAIVAPATRNVTATNPPHPAMADRRSASGSFFPYALEDEAVRWIVPLWLAGVVGMAMRLATSWMRIQAWRFTAKPMVDMGILDLVARLEPRMGLARKVRLLISNRVSIPMTMGWLKPVILLPAQVVTGLSMEELEAVLAHELAHIARHDYLVNLVQSAIEVVLFYHPAVWWLSRQIREIREECCDEAVLRAGANRLAYAKALADLAELQLGGSIALGATGGSLLNRVARLVGRPRQESPWTRSQSAWALSLAGALVAAMAILYSARLIAQPDPDAMIANTLPAPTGQVIDSSGAPTPGAQVLLYYHRSVWGLGNRVVEKVLADAGGHFSFNHPLTFTTPNGTDRGDHYIVVASHEGLAPAWTVIVGGLASPGALTLQLTKPVSQTFEVVDLKGQPVAGATLWLRYAAAQTTKPPFFFQALLLPEDLGFCHATTDASGHATLANLPDTEHSVAASKEGFEDEVSGTTPANGVPRFTLKPGAVLEGRVTDPLGMPIEGVTVWVYPKFRWHQYFMAKTDRDGHYRIDKIWSNRTTKDWGKYDAGIRDPRFTAAKRDVAFTSGQTISNFNFSATPGVEVIGKLLDPSSQQPVAGGEILIDSDAGRQSTVTDASGSFRCRVPEGMARIFFSGPPGGTYAIDDRSRNQSYLNARAFGSEYPVTLYTPSALGKLGILRGKVVDAAGHPAPFCQVSSAVADNPATRILTTGWTGNIFRGVTTKEDGTFVLTLPVGLTFTLTAENPAGDAIGMLSTGLATAPLDLPTPIVLQATNTASILLTDLSGAPRRNFAVDVVPRAKGVEMWLNQKDYRTDADGVLHLPNVIPGLTYRISQQGSNDAWNFFDPASQSASAGTPKLLITDRYILRVTDNRGGILPVKNLKEFYVWILDRGQRVRWTNTVPDKLDKLGDDVVLDRKTVVLGQPGEQMDMLIETTSGDLVRASGNIPAKDSGILLAKATETAPLDYTDDPSVGPVQPDEVAGRIVDPTGHPVSGATITFNAVFWSDMPVGMEHPTFTTGPDGIFRVPHTANKWFCYETVSKAGFAPVFLTDIPKGKGFVVRLQNTTRFTGSIGGDRPGKVKLLLEKDKDTARAEMGNRILNIQFRTETDADGAYDFPIEPGTYRFKAISADGRFAIGEVTAVVGRAASLPAVLQPGIPVTLRLTDCQTGRSVPGIEVGILEQRPDSVYQEADGSSRVSDEKGELHWDNLMPGKTQFSSMRMTSAIPGQTQPPYVRWWCAGYGYRSYPGKTRDSNEVDYSRNPPTRSDGVGDLFVDVQKAMEPVSVLVEKGAKVSGTVTGADGTPQKDVSVGVVPNDGYSETLTGDSRFTFFTDAQGKFSGYIPAGNGVTYNLCAYLPVQRYSPSGDLYPLAAWANAVSEPFNSKPDDELRFDLKMSKGGWITGKLLGSGGKFLPSMAVTATNADRMDVAYGKRIVMPDPNGNFRLGPLRPGHYTIQSGRAGATPLQPAQATEANSKQVDIADGQQVDVGPLPMP